MSHNFKEKIVAFLTEPALPPVALSIARDEVAVADVRWKKGKLVIGRAAVEPIPEGTLDPSFEGVNIKNRDALVKGVQKAIERAGLAHQKKWAVAIPSVVCRTFILELEEAPATGKGLAQVLEWKVERFVGLAAADLHIGVQRLVRTTKSDRFLVVAARVEAISSYEAALGSLGIRPGFIVPAQLAEVGWLFMDAIEGDSMLVSLDDQALSMLFARNDEILAVRTVPCTAEAVKDELHRTIVYYQDKLSRIAERTNGPDLSSVSAFPGEGPVETSGSMGEESHSSAASAEDVDEKGVRTGKGSQAAGAGIGDQRLKLIVLINHNEKGRSEETSWSRSGSVQEVQQICRELFPDGDGPRVYSLNQERFARDPSLTLSRLSAAVGITSIG